LRAASGEAAFTEAFTRKEKSDYYGLPAAQMTDHGQEIQISRPATGRLTAEAGRAM
jgi:hypothetical protein